MSPCPSVKRSEGRVFAYKKGGNLVEKDAGRGKRRLPDYCAALCSRRQETSLSLDAGGCEVAVEVTSPAGSADSVRCRPSRFA
jgi:hypothetical protein